MTAEPPTTTGTDDSSAGASPRSLVVRRDVRRSLRAALALLGVSVLLVFWVPAIIVLARSEAAYFTNGILWSALIATVVALLVGAGLTLWWARRGRVLLSADAAGIRLPATRQHPELEAAWADVAMIRLIGTRNPTLAIHVREIVEEQSAESAEPQLDLTEPEFLRPLDFQSDPPPPTKVPSEDAFDKIKPLPQEEDSEDDPEPRPKSGAALHATPYVVSLTNTDPPLSHVLRAITVLSAGRVRLD
ncbi:hypothetical protein [Cumulibacter soli]|uniref:hypothetical protein n=1 Tax=Cumulibacter soli TaxID=2546344 RepID=UPI001067F481|nr:hypothetical protein [Cumulibacter soli]